MSHHKILFELKYAFHFIYSCVMKGWEVSDIYANIWTKKVFITFFLMNFVIRTHNSDLSRPDDTVTYFRIKTRQHKKVINYFSIKILHEKQLPIIILTRLTCLIKTKVYTKKKTSSSSPISCRTEIHSERKKFL